MASDNGGAQEVARNLPLSGAKQMLQEGGIRVMLNTCGHTIVSATGSYPTSLHPRSIT
jgi:hypothetical protein